MLKRLTRTGLASLASRMPWSSIPSVKWPNWRLKTQSIFQKSLHRLPQQLTGAAIWCFLFSCRMVWQRKVNCCYTSGQCETSCTPFLFLGKSMLLYWTALTCCWYSLSFCINTVSPQHLSWISCWSLDAGPIQLNKQETAGYTSPAARQLQTNANYPNWIVYIYYQLLFRRSFFLFTLHSFFSYIRIFWLTSWLGGSQMIGFEAEKI